MAAFHGREGYDNVLAKYASSTIFHGRFVMPSCVEIRVNRIKLLSEELCEIISKMDAHHLATQPKPHPSFTFPHTHQISVWQ